MNLQNIEAYANEACFATDNNIKFHAEAIFREFMFSLHPSQYPHILENFSQTVLFVFLSFLNKKTFQPADIIEIFRQLKGMALKWYLPNGQFKRPYDSQYLVSYVVNTLGLVLGKCMKQIYLIQKSKKDLIDYFREETNSLFKLFLYKNFIETLSIIDNDMEYVPYRTMVYSFQQKMIPMFLQQLYPYFISVTDTIKINELSSMLPTLSQKPVSHQFDLFRPQDKMVSQIVFKLLSQIVSFKFNITFSQYDLEGEIEHCMITFPESILTHLISREFLEAFYFMLEKMVAMNYQGSYFQTTFECLKKILLSKVTNLSKEQKSTLMHLHYVGLFRLIKANISSQKTMTKVFECIYKFIHAFDFRQLQNNHLNHIELSTIIKEKALMVIKQTQLSNDNRMFHSTCELVCKVASESLAMSQQKYLEFYKQLCMDFYMTFFDAFITKDYNIFGKVNLQKVSTLVTILSDFFHYVNKIGSMDMGFMFNVILSRCEQALMSKNPTKIANYLFVVTNISDENFFDRNLVYEATKDDDLKILGNLIHNCFEFIDFYKKSASSQKLIDIAILLLFEKILTQCLCNLSNTDQEVHVVSLTYKVINMYKKIPTSDENFLMFCFDELGLSLNTEDYQKVEHILEVFHSLLLKLKWTLRREYFTQSRISKQILQKTIELSRNSLQSTPALLKQRRKLFKIITILSFDDLLDSYRSNIDFVVDSLSLDFNKKNFSKIIFDMSGICQNIDAAVIYKYFLTKINQKIGLQTLIKTLYQIFCNDLPMLEQVVYLNSSLLSDKSLRMTSKQLSPFIYDIIDYSIEFLSGVLDAARDGAWNDVLNEVFTLTNILFEASYINLYLIKRKCKDKFMGFLYKLADNLLANHLWANDYPELSKTMHETFKLFFTNATQVVFSWEDKSQAQQQLLTKFIQLIQCTMTFCHKTLQQAAESGKNYQLSEMFLQTISKLYSFMRYKRNSVHRKNLIEIIERIQVENQLHAVNFLQALYKVSMTNIKNIATVLNAICICIMEISYFYPTVYEEIFISLGIPHQKIGKIERIYKNIQNFNEDPLFLSNIREWLSKSENHYDSEIDY